MFPYIKTGVLFLDELLIFAIKIPRFSSEIFSKSFLVPVPNNDGLELDVSTSLVYVFNGTDYMFKEMVTEVRQLTPHNDLCIRNL